MAIDFSLFLKPKAQLNLLFQKPKYGIFLSSLLWSDLEKIFHLMNEIV
jgi:hypothetical protein